MQNFHDAKLFVPKERWYPRGIFLRISLAILHFNIFRTLGMAKACGSYLRHIYEQVVSSGAIYTRSAHAIRNLESYSKIF